MAFLTVLKESDVHDAESFNAYCNQTIGTKYITSAKEMAALRGKTNQFLADNDLATWYSLVKTVHYVRSTRKRLAMPWSVISWVPYTYTDGRLPEMDPANRVTFDHDAADGIAKALEVETNEDWVHVLSMATGDRMRVVLGEWRQWRRAQEKLSA